MKVVVGYGYNVAARTLRRAFGPARYRINRWIVPGEPASRAAFDGFASEGGGFELARRLAEKTPPVNQSGIGTRASSGSANLASFAFRPGATAVEAPAPGGRLS
jgi:hypothetical protein